MSKTAKKQFVSPNDVETLVLDWDTLKWLSSPRVTGAQRFTTGVAEIQAGKRHAPHSHPGIEEIIYVVRGAGDQTVGKLAQSVRAGDLVHVPPGVEHSTINTGDETLTLLVVYAPPGPEETFRNMPGCRIVPPRRGRSESHAPS